MLFKERKRYDRILSWFLLLFFFSAGLVFPAEEILRVGYHSDYPPYEWMDTEGKPKGFHIDLLRAIARNQGWSLEFQSADANQLRQKLMAGEVDLVSGLFFSSEEDLKFDFSTPHSVVGYSIFVWREDKTVRKIEDLKGKTVYAVRRDLMHDYLLSKRMGILLMLASSPREAIELLSAHRGQAAAIPKYQGFHYMKTLALDNVKAVGKAFQPVEFCFAVREGNAELLSKLNQGLADLKASGQYDRFRDRWLAALEPKATLSDFMPALIVSFSILLALLIGLWLWNWILQSEVQRKTEEIRKANEQLKRIGEFKTEIVNSVAHEFKTPLAVIQGYVDYLLDGSGGPLVKEQRTIAQKIDRVVSKLVRLVIDLLDVAKLEAGKLKLDIQEIEALSMVEEISTIFQEQFASREIQLVKRVDPPALKFFGDRARIEECLLNLVDNAIKYSPNGGEIGISVFPEGQSVRFEVTDTGSGIPSKELKRIFERFERTSHEPSVAGFGLGLAITKDFIKLHGGRIWVESEEGKGSKFIFVLPKSPLYPPFEKAG